MARARSPEYPAIGLNEAIERVGMVWKKDYQNRVPRKVIAEHMGYKGISGASLPVLSALTKYGLLDGRGDETFVSDLAVAILAHPPGTRERVEALKNAAAYPDLFVELDARFPGGASEQAIRSYLLTNKFIPSAADAAIRAYRDTKTLVEAESGGYVEPAKQQEGSMTPAAIAKDILDRPATDIRYPQAKHGILQEVFNLDEGPVTLTFPAKMSVASYEDLEAHLQIFLRKAKRRADSIRQFNLESGDPDSNEVG